MPVSSDQVKRLRQLTGVSMMLCKKVLDETNGDADKAMALLKKSSEALAAKKSERTTGAGIIETYIHGNRRVGVMLEIRSETDFVSRNEEFHVLAHDIALHIAAMSPGYVSQESIPEEAKEEAKRLFMTEAGNLGKTPEMTAKIVTGKLEAHFRDTSLLSQYFVKDPAITIEELVKRAIGKFGEKIEVVRFVRYEL
ncbi:MAG: elongation factor Ts [bacterium]|nr:elongation factor Ts [bacterium]